MDDEQDIEEDFELYYGSLNIIVIVIIRYKVNIGLVHCTDLVIPMNNVSI